MKKVLKNVFKSIAIVSLILQIFATVFLAGYTVVVKRYAESNPQEIINVGKSFVDDENWESKDEFNKHIGYLVVGLSSYLRLTTIGSILAFSIAIGSIIGVVQSIDEKSKKKLIITYFAMYAVMFLVFCLYELIAYRDDPYLNLKDTIFRLGLEGFVIYTVIYVLAFIAKKINNNRKVKLMNKELKAEQ